MLAGSMEAPAIMQRDTENLGNDDDPEEFEEEESLAELCRGRTREPHKLGKRGRMIVGDLMDRVKREDASKAANIQDSERLHVGSTRYDVNSYVGGPATIRDLCFVEKRKVR
jgi:hypothetical protein